MGRILALNEYSPYNFSLEGNPRKSLILIMVGTGRFELPTPRTPSECSTRLSHVPTQSSRSALANRLLGSESVYTSKHRPGRPEKEQSARTNCSSNQPSTPSDLLSLPGSRLQPPFAPWPVTVYTVRHMRNAAQCCSLPLRRSHL